MMSADTNSAGSGEPRNPDDAGLPEEVLTFDEVSFNTRGGEGFDLRLAAGELAAFEVASGEAMPAVADLAVGLTAPLRGDIRFLGTAWSRRSEPDALQQRFSIGQVFNSRFHAAWIENLDIDENVYLASQMAGQSSQAELVRRADELAKAFGLDSLPGGRRAIVPRRELMLAQWVRAFLPKTLKLLILERPTLGMDADSVNLLHARITAAREAGTAVVWLDTDFQTSKLKALSPNHHFTSIPPALLP